VTRPRHDPDPSRWETIEEICFEAMSRHGPERQAFLDRRCAGDSDLRARVEHLLEALDRAPEFLERPAASIPAPPPGSSSFPAGHGPEDTGGSSPDGPHPMAARVIAGRYRIVRPLGHGGMGDVFLATLEGDGFERSVALKLIRRGLDTERVLERFRQERRILAGLRHPNIAGLLDGGATADGRPFFVMEFVDGEPIDEFCDRTRASVRERLETIEVLCGAVHHAHQNLVVHRDIKPPNVLVDSDGTPTLLDFGIGKALSSDQDADGGVTRVEERALTPDFAAPEILKGDPVTTATDVYGLGVLLYILLAGTLPYPRGGSPAEQLTARSRRPPRPGDVAPPGRKIPGELDAVVLKAMAPEPEERYGSAAALAEDLRRYLEGRPVRARPPGMLYSARKFVARHRAAAVATVGVMVALVGATAYTALQSRRVAAERDKALEVRGFLLESFGAAGANRALGDSVTARALLDGQAAAVRGSYADRPDLQAEMMLVLAEGYERLGLFTEALGWAEEAQELTARANPGERAAAATLLGWITHQLGRTDEALPLLEAAVADARREGDRSRALARALNDLGVVQEALGRFEEAARSHEEALALRAELFGPDHRSVAVSASNLSVIRYRQGDFEGAVREAGRALEVVRTAFGPDHQRSIIVQNNLAVFRLVAGDLQGAEDDFRDLWARQARIQGPDHPVTVRVMNSLASVLRQQEKWMEAESVLREVLRITEESPEPNPTDLATTLANLGDAVSWRGGFQEADSLIRQALRLQTDVLGPDHLDVANSQVFMSNLYERSDDLEEAVRWREEAAGTFARVLGAGHEAPLTQRVEHGRLLAAAGRWDEARAVLEEVEEAAAESLGAVHPLVSRAREELARTGADS
jgi:serine/threonine-protein kinase